MTVNVIDSDDQKPTFSEAKYSAQVVHGLVAKSLNVQPEKIRAEDQDTLRTPVQYKFIGGNPESFQRYFRIDPHTGVVSQIEAVQENVQKFLIKVKVSKETNLAWRIQNPDLKSKMGYIGF